MPPIDALYWGPAAKGTPKQLVVLCHGLGADAHDLFDLAPAWAPAVPDALFASVNAPNPHPSGFGRQWWEVGDRSPAMMEAGVRSAAVVLDAFLDAELARLGLPADAYALMGFSQGAMTALFTGLRRAVPPRAILAFSGALLAPESLARRNAQQGPGAAGAWRGGRRRAGDPFARRGAGAASGRRAGGKQLHSGAWPWHRRHRCWRWAAWRWSGPSPHDSMVNPCQSGCGARLALS